MVLDLLCAHHTQLAFSAAFPLKVPLAFRTEHFLVRDPTLCGQVLRIPGTVRLLLGLITPIDTPPLGTDL